MGSRVRGQSMVRLEELFRGPGDAPTSDVGPQGTSEQQRLGVRACAWLLLQPM